MTHSALPFAAVAAALVLVTGGTSTVAEDSAGPELASEILPLLKARCVSCHGPAKQGGKLHLALPQGIRRGGEHGLAVVPGDPEGSLLWQKVASDEMPEGSPLPPEEKDLLYRWIRSGAPGLPQEVSPEPAGDEHWAFQHLLAEPIPEPRDADLCRTPVDNFLLARLEAAQLTLGPEADRLTLIRRVSFDVTGLPPSPAEIAEFLNDAGEGAYERMVDRYLQSAHYGERWGKYWLDAAGYADSNGYFGADTDRPFAWRYRDYVIRSLNADKPWDQFIREQLAGDELAGYSSDAEVSPGMIELLEAVHYLRNSPDGTDSSDGNPDEVRADKYAVLEGTVQIMGSSLFGMTFQCARCHDHKFEPFSQRSYYELQAAIYPAFNIEQWVKPKGRVISTATAAELAAHDNEIRRIDGLIAEQRSGFAAWARSHREKGQILFEEGFSEESGRISELWTNTVPGDAAPAGSPPVQLDSATAPAARLAEGSLLISESGAPGDRAVSTHAVFDWTPEPQGAWVQATFDLVAGRETAPYVGFFVALRDFNDVTADDGGNILLDGSAAGGAGVHVDYPGSDSRSPGRIGTSSYVPGRNYGVRITNTGGGQFELAQIVDGVPEEGRVMLRAADLPDGGFGFEYCCGRSFVVDNVVIEQRPPDSLQTETEQALVEMHRRKRMELEAAIQGLEAQRPQPVGQLALVSDLSGEPPAVRMLTRGSYKTPGEEVQAVAPRVVSDETNPPDLTRLSGTGSRTTGRRLALAVWLTKPESRAAALLARVTVNRWWQHHFGTGIVATPDNLGYSGAPPTHPELIDFLARQLTVGGWRAKAVHRMILNSAAFRQVSSSRPDGEARDPQNLLLWKYPLRRLDAEAIRDAMLAAGGDLDRTMFGPYVPTERNAEGDVVVPEQKPGATRRSMYLQQKRTQVTGMLDAFDAPSIVFNCTARSPTTVPLQSLKLLNSEFVRLRARAMEARSRERAEDLPERIRAVFRQALGRPPTDEEFAVSQRFLETQPSRYEPAADAEMLAWTDFCQMLLASNAFLYVE